MDQLILVHQWIPYGSVESHGSVDSHCSVDSMDHSHGSVDPMDQWIPTDQWIPKLAGHRSLGHCFRNDSQNGWKIHKRRETQLFCRNGFLGLESRIGNHQGQENEFFQPNFHSFFPLFCSFFGVSEHFNRASLHPLLSQPSC